MPAVQRRVRARLNARLRADGARPRPTKVLIGAALVAATALVGLLLHRTSSTNRPGQSEQPLSGQPPVGRPDGGAQQDYPGRCFEATFFSDHDFGTPVHTRRDCQIAFDWGKGTVPDVPSLRADSFSIRWEGVLEPPSSDSYTFSLASDDGSRLYLNDQLVVDNWGVHGPAEVVSQPIELASGAQVPIVVEYFELGGIAQVELSWSSATLDKQPLSGKYVRPRRGSQPAGGDGGAQPPSEIEFGPSQCFAGSYFVGRDLQQLAHTRRDCHVDFDWGFGAPSGVEGLSKDDFSVRWEGRLRVPTTDEYVFHLASDDGSRFYLDDELMVGDWSEHGFGFLASPPTKLTEGVTYPIVVEFFEAADLATVRLEWSSSTLQRQLLSGRWVSAPASEGGVPNQGDTSRGTGP